MRAHCLSTRRLCLVVGLGLGAWLGLGAGVCSQEHQHHPPALNPADPADYAYMGPHMKVTAKRPPNPEDIERADFIVERTRAVIEKFRDYRVALDDGFKPFLRRLPLPEYHFTNYGYGFEAGFRFNIDHPTSLLYVKEGDGYRLTGVMFTAPASASLDELNSRLPLSVAQWHLHVNICLPPPGQGAEMLRPNARFGFEGTIATREECHREGGRFLPRIFGWMVHVYPFEEQREAVFRMPGHHQHSEEHRH